MECGNIKLRRALISVADKTGLFELANLLVANDCEIIATGSSASFLLSHNIPVTKVSDITEYPEIMDGRVKTLHPKIHGGILGKRDSHHDDAAKHNISWIDLVVCNFYPFAKVLQDKKITVSNQASDKDLANIVDNIDIGGPALVRASAKNYDWVTCLSSPSHYDEFIIEYKKNTSISLDFRKKMAVNAFALTSSYDSTVYNFFNNEELPQTISLSLSKEKDLRYGENPHQKASIYRVSNFDTKNNSYIHLNGKELSYNNLVDINSAVKLIQYFQDVSASVVIKHATPCGAAIDSSIDEAFNKAFLADKKSAFGGIVAINKKCTEFIAKELSNNFIEAIIAPDFSDIALSILQSKPNLRVIKIPDIKFYLGENDITLNHLNNNTILAQTNFTNIDKQNLNVVTKNKPSIDIVNELDFAWSLAQQVKSNAIVITKNLCSLGIGAGQVSRVDAVELAIKKARAYNYDLNNAVLASDGFFPFSDNIEILKNTGIKHIIQPGGSIRDHEIIDACNKYGISMTFTGVRVFCH